MVAFCMGIILGALGGFMFLVLLSEVVRKDELVEWSEPHEKLGEMSLNRSGLRLSGRAN